MMSNSYSLGAGPTPDTEQECAQKGNYTYLPTNIISYKLRMVQKSDIQRRFKLTQGIPSACTCVPVNGKKCVNSSCNNKMFRIACPPSCGEMCFNNPWENKKLFAIGVKTCMMRTVNDTGWGIFATARIAGNEYIGEFTGVVLHNSAKLDMEARNYAFGLTDIPHIIDPYKKGNALRCVNHSCSPNCRAVEVVHNGTYKIIFEAIKNILPGEELTIDYNWEFTSLEEAQKCKCQSENCNGFIGTLRKIAKPTRRKQPKILILDNYTNHQKDNAVAEFPAVAAGSPQLERLMMNQPLHQHDRPKNYFEAHIFSPLETCCIIIQCRGQLGIVSGHVQECFKNEHGVFIYVVRYMNHRLMYAYLPRWTCFHFIEDAAFVLEQLYSLKDKGRLLQYTLPETSRQMALGLSHEVVQDYVKRWTLKTFPSFTLHQMKMPGNSAIGLSNQYLAASKQESRPKSRVWKGINVAIKSHNKAIPPSSAIQEFPDYDPHFRKPFQQALDDQQRSMRLRECLENACKLVTFYAFSRDKSDYLDKVTLYDIVYADLNWHYNLAQPHRRKFPLFSHYQLATENQVSENKNLWRCSLCPINTTFVQKSDFCQHFKELHQICAPSYQCSKCNKDFSLPSNFRRHLLKYSSDLSLKLCQNYLDCVIDAYADYVANTNHQSIKTSSPL